MRDESPLPVSTSTSTTTHSHSHSHSNSSSVSKKETLDCSIFKRGRYKYWILSVITLLAFWSIFTLHLSLTNLNRLSDDFSYANPIYNDFDVLEIEEREKVVKHMWDVYINSRRIKLPRFWQEAFVAAYEELSSDALQVREAAVSEITKMSLHSNLYLGRRGVRLRMKVEKGFLWGLLNIGVGERIRENDENTPTNIELNWGI